MEYESEEEEKLDLIKKIMGMEITIVPFINHQIIGVGLTTDGRILITETMVSMFEPDELCCSIAHELAHIQLGHSKTDDESYMHRTEFEADEKAINIAISFGVNPGGLYRALRRIVSLDPASEFLTDSEHPSYSDRLRRIAWILQKKGYGVFA